MRDTTWMELFERAEAREPLSGPEMISVLRNFGLVVPKNVEDHLHPDIEFSHLLETIGWGHYDYQTKIWTPSSHQIYSFDAEVFDIDSMYNIYLQGLQSISEGELTFSRAAQDMSKVNWEEPSGTVGVTFCLNGMECHYDASFQGDWLDTKIRVAVNHCLEKLGIEKRFYATAASQGETIFFCTEEWAREFENATLCYMNDTVQ